MSVQQIKGYLTTLKLHIDEADRWVKQATNIAYEIEEKLMDMEDDDYKNKYETVPEFNLPRLNTEHCFNYQNDRQLDIQCDYATASFGFYQSELSLK